MLGRICCIIKIITVYTLFFMLASSLRGYLYVYKIYTCFLYLYLHGNVSNYIYLVIYCLKMTL